MKKIIFIFFLTLIFCFFTVGCKKNNGDHDENNKGGEDEVEVDWGDLGYDQHDSFLYDLI